MQGTPVLLSPIKHSCVLKYAEKSMFVPVYLSSLYCVLFFVMSLFYVALKVRMSSLFIKGYLT